MPEPTSTPRLGVESGYASWYASSRSGWASNDDTGDAT